jgi:hypothetical protein
MVFEPVAPAAHSILRLVFAPVSALWEGIRLAMRFDVRSRHFAWGESLQALSRSE